MSSPVEVTCPAGTVIGTADGGISYFHAIEYAHFPAPFNDAEPAPKGLLIDATEPNPDKVALSIVAPKNATDAPVIVHIHGGRFEEGSHEDPASPGEALAEQGVILVRIGYRKKLEGLVPFFDDQPNHFRAVDDVNLGLEWVQRNIESFGGDPTNVTLSGQSAGAAVVLWLMRKDHYRGAFRRAIAMAPAFPNKNFQKRKSALRIPTTRTWLNKAKPTTLERAYKRLRRRYPTDMALGPNPLDPTEMAEIPLVISCHEKEFQHPIIGPRLTNKIILRWVNDVVERAPGEVHKVTFTGESQHCDELFPLFCGPLTEWLVHYATTGETNLKQETPLALPPATARK
ncbi:carboxylesterase family protein [uncultured Corynebacterium sp.]|uniref:carboxylesterase family protein n=1 Tax=uncultured Corynebacterium sp. TaxID=159447 RepID=UPI00260CA446|nr:carboxylesterase family protein [uncultured Corynebacterium sp.]